MKQGVFAQSALIAFAVPGQLNNPLCKCLPRGFGVTARSKADPGSVYGLPSLIERSSQNANGLGIEYAVSVVMEKLVHFNTPFPGGSATGRRGDCDNNNTHLRPLDRLPSSNQKLRTGDEVPMQAPSSTPALRRAPSFSHE